MSMTLDEYQEHVLRTSNPWVDADPSLSLTNWALGMTGESGEFADLVKKHVFHEHDLDEAKAIKELGDVLWYVARAAKTLDVSLSDVAAINVAKLQARYPNGWTREDSIARVDTRPNEGEFVATGKPARPAMVKAPVAVFAMGPGHQTEPWCAVHDSSCPEWCESDPSDIEECAS